MESVMVAFSLILGTATPGGGFPVYGAAFAEMVNAQEPRLSIETRNTKGSAENVPLLEAGKLAAAPRPELLHPGVRKYLAEIGLLR